MATDNDTCKIKVLETVPAPFARTLEREVIALTAERDHWQEIARTMSAEREHNANVAQEMTAERDQLRAERAEAELATERARLDSGTILLTVAGERVWHCGVDLRAAIDAAMKEDAK